MISLDCRSEQAAGELVVDHIGGGGGGEEVRACLKKEHKQSWSRRREGESPLIGDGGGISPSRK